MKEPWEYIGCLVATDRIVKWDAYDVSDADGWSQVMCDHSEMFEDPACIVRLWDCSSGERPVAVPQDEAEEIVAAGLVNHCEDMIVSLYAVLMSHARRLPRWIMDNEGDRIYAIHEDIPFEEYL